jgi:hypothetical protein
MKVKNTILIISLFFSSINIYPNDAFVKAAGGNYAILGDKNTEIQMVSEKIKIDMYDRYYKMDITFLFFNNGGTATVKVGFPEYSWGLYGSTNIQDFQTFIGDNQMAVEYISNEPHKDEGSYDLEINAWYVKEVEFKSKEYVTSRVTYSAEYAHLGFHRGIQYLYGTGSTWKGVIGEMNIEITNHTDSWLGSFRFYIHDEQNNFQAFVNRIDEKIIINANDILPYKTDTFMLDFENRPVFYNDYSIRGNINGKVYSKNDLKLLTSNQLRLLRNSIYAHHNYQFKSKDLLDYFNDDSERSSEIFNERNFTEIENENLKNIIEEENSRKNGSV